MKQTRDDAITALRENVGFLRRSGEHFDAGEEAEAKRIAVAVRTLVWDKGRNRSILGILGVKEGLEFVDTADAPIEAEPGVLLWHMGFGLAAVTGVDGALTYIAPLDGRDRLEPASFEPWWIRPILNDMQKNAFSREDLVLDLARKEGGAHFDPEMPRAYGELARENSLGYSFSDAQGEMRPAGSPVPANVRQIGWELQTTIEEQLTELL